MEFFKQVGKMAVGTRVRFLGERIGADAAEIYRAYGTDLNPKWFPVFYILSKNEVKTVTEIAEDIGHSHASVSKILREMSKAGVIKEKTDSKDRRRTLVGLSKLGQEIADKIELQYQDVNAAIEELSSEANNDLWRALEEWEYLLSQKSLLQRVYDKKKQRESIDVKIEAYQPKHQQAFRKLNEEWIKTYFKMEKPDYDALDNPKKYILDRGGFIFVATIDKYVVGVCALLWREDLKVYELAKMAVDPKFRGKNIGYILGRAAIDKCVSLKADRLYLESNTILTPAIKLYEKLGFKKVAGPPTPYERCNIQMELKLR